MVISSHNILIVPTAGDVCEIDCMIDSCDCTAAIVGGVVAIIFILSIALIIIVVLVLRTHQGTELNNKRYNNYFS